MDSKKILKEDPGLHRSYSEGTILLGVLLIAIGLLFYKLGVRSLNNWDEAIYAQISKEVVNSGNWLTLHWGYRPWFHKPPLFMWMTAFAYQIFGISEFSARAASALSGVGIVGCTYLIAQRLHGKLAALMAVVVLLTNFSFVHYARFGTTDITLTFFILISLYSFLRALAGEKTWWYLLGISTACALMTKGVLGLVIPMTVLLTLIVNGQLWQVLRLRFFWIGGAIAMLLITPWHGIAIYQHGQSFIDQYFLYHVVARSTGSIEGHTGGLGFYFVELAKNFFPWVWLVPVAAILQLKESFSEQGKENRVLLILATLILGGFTLVGTKLVWYIVPCYPVFSIWVGHLIQQASKRHYSMAFFSLLTVSALACVLTPQRVVFLSSAEKNLVALIGIISLVLSIGYLLRFTKLYRVTVLLLCSVLVLSGLREIRGLYLGNNDPVVILAKSAGQVANPNQQSLIVVSLTERLYVPTAMFYSDRPIYWVRSIEELETAPGQDAILAKEDIKLLDAQYKFEILSEAQKLAYAKITKR